jgi:hypothetical protein
MARWNSCNILHLAPDAKRLWQFDAKGGGFVLNREQRVLHTEPFPKKGIAKSWATLWQPRLNVAWLPLEAVFLRVVELPASHFEETLAMVELQLEKLSPIPLAQIVWTMHVIGTHNSPAKADGTVEHLQTVVVVIAERGAVEEFLGRLERDGYLADRLEVPMLDQLEALRAGENPAAGRDEAAADAWVFPISMGGQNAALTAWWTGGVLRHLSLVTLPAAGDRSRELKNQIDHIAWSGELDGWLPSPPKWHLVADPVNATEWEGVLREAVGEPVPLTAPLPPAELAARTARRAAASQPSSLLPPEFSVRYRQQFVDRLWLRGLAYAGLAYAVCLVIYFCAVAVLNYRTTGLETRVAALGGSYTNAMQLKARLGVLKERQQLKYAALDCWKLVAEELPQSITLQRFSFTDGHTLTLSGTAPQDQVNTLFDFNTALKKKKVNGELVFDQNKGDPVNPRLGPNNVETWSFSLELLHSEKSSK